MTVSSQIPYNAYTYAGSTIFVFNFRLIQATDLQVSVAGVVQPSSNYTVSGVGSQSGGSITYTGSLTVGQLVELQRITILQRATDYQDEGDFLAATVNADYDRMWMALQEQQRGSAQALRVPESAGIPVLPAAASRAGFLLGFDGSGAFALISAAAQSATALALNLLSNVGSTLVNFLPKSLDANMVLRTVDDKLSYLVDTRDAGADSTGIASATAGLVKAFNKAWDTMYFASPWAGSGTAYPVVNVSPGRYKLDGTLTISNGVSLKGPSHPVNTTSHTRFIMNSTATVPGGGAGDNRNTPMIRFTRATRNGAALTNTACTFSIEDMEFWFVTLGNVFDTPLSGASIPFAYNANHTVNAAGYPLGATLYIDVDVTDARITNCCFQHSPAAIHIRNVGSTVAMRPDGFNGGSGVNLYVEDCEFDAGAAHLLAENSFLDLHFKNCEFYGGIHLYLGCSGKVVYENCRFYGGAYIDASDLSNSFSVFIVNGGDIEQYTGGPTISIRNAKTCDVKYITITGASGAIGLLLQDCSGGSVSELSISQSGYNASAGTGITDYTAAIKMLGCNNMVVANNQIGIIAGDGATYNGFGILTGPSSARASGKNYVHGNNVTAPYNGASYRVQDRFINLDPLDILGANYNDHNPQYVGTFSGGLSVVGNRVQPTSLLGSAATFDLAAQITSSGIYEVYVQTQYQSNLAQINVGKFLFMRRAAGGAIAIQEALANPAATSGVISLAGTTLSFTYTAGTAYYLTISVNKLASNGVE